ncbi:hypothetical protein P171DRAFT_380253 [Karstenula rhodostoma CBS 690.94]|uniref:Uncharacterized protein n=1 Tax=Karstenula rhodostoma CBS 690.94 TaxID=1392251 RepID=A0A9P4UGU8_9PLEO|nr:hypothetical protein P171DRAFT_380253 [Karstenula rhodostoma CBS 690.94]
MFLPHRGVQIFASVWALVTCFFHYLRFSVLSLARTSRNAYVLPRLIGPSLLRKYCFL